MTLNILSVEGTHADMYMYTETLFSVKKNKIAYRKFFTLRIINTSHVRMYMCHTGLFKLAFSHLLKDNKI